MRVRIVVGSEAPAPAPHRIDGEGPTVHVRTCREALRWMRRASFVDLVIADTGMQLPDGTWKDLVRMVVTRNIPGQLRVVDRFGHAVFSCALDSTRPPERAG